MTCSPTSAITSIACRSRRQRAGRRAALWWRSARAAAIRARTALSSVSTRQGATRCSCTLVMAGAGTYLQLRSAAEPQSCWEVRSTRSTKSNLGSHFRRVRRRLPSPWRSDRRRRADVRLRAPGGIPERSKGMRCKRTGSAIPGSNPGPAIPLARASISSPARALDYPPGYDHLASHVEPARTDATVGISPWGRSTHGRELGHAFPHRFRDRVQPRRARLYGCPGPGGESAAGDLQRDLRIRAREPYGEPARLQQLVVHALGRAS